ncbi:50S ribosomal protein L21 [Candidatus Uhrbacteria bacterium]|nr:50S ribosomal protein L21 [Candidatus Uhrbacteria bacterium]
MLAVIRTGGKQYIVKEGDVLIVEKLKGDENDSVTFKDVLLIFDEAGEQVQVGSPVLNGIQVTGTIVEQGRGKKISVIKYKRKVRYRRKKGHRQHITKVKITKIG